MRFARRKLAREAAAPGCFSRETSPRFEWRSRRGLRPRMSVSNRRIPDLTAAQKDFEEKSGEDTCCAILRKREASWCSIIELFGNESRSRNQTSMAALRSNPFLTASKDGCTGAITATASWGEKQRDQRSAPECQSSACFRPLSQQAPAACAGFEPADPFDRAKKFSYHYPITNCCCGERSDRSIVFSTGVEPATGGYYPLLYQ